MKPFMKEGISMSLRIIDVLLTTLGEDRDVLRFNTTEDSVIDIDLDSSTCQTEIKRVFSEILKMAVSEDIDFRFSTEDGFPRELYKDVCEEYIKDITRELKTSIVAIRN